MGRDHDLNKLSKKFIHEKSAHSKKAESPSRWSSVKLGNHVSTSSAANVSVYFDDIQELFIDLCNTYEVVVGAVAWMTNARILSALSKPSHVAIVVQKEDFLRRDVGYSSFEDQRRSTRSLYEGLQPFDFGDFLETYPGQQEDHPQYNSTAQSWLFDNKGNYSMPADPVRCLGFRADPKKRFSPRMHHKFLVFGHKSEGLIMWSSCVVTGSFNLTHNAVRSRENVVLIHDEKISQSYLSEWAQLWSMSEPLDWSSDEPSPEEFYVGT